MRISDWSSDVCSSDLPSFRRGDDPVSADDFFGLEEIGDFDRGIFVAVRPVDRVRLDAPGQFLADRAGRGLPGVGRAPDVAVRPYRPFAFQNLDADGAAGHAHD